MCKDVLIISMFSKNESSYARHYTDAFDERSVSYDIVFFERYGADYEPADNELLFQEYCPTGGRKAQKLGAMARYAHFIRKLASSGAYRSLVVLTTLPAIMLTDILLKNYQGMFILDIRDQTYESNLAYHKVLYRIINASSNTVVSSAGFLAFLPESDKYVFAHNIAKGYVEQDRDEYFPEKKVVFGFVGSVRYFNVNSRLCAAMNDSKRFKLAFYGTHALDCDLESFCRDKNYRNIVFGGAFSNADKDRIYKNVDIINSVYDTSMAESIYAVPNRFYDAAVYKCPIVVSKGTFLANQVEQYHLGLSVDVFTDDIELELESYIDSFDKCAFEDGCMRLLKDVEIDLRGQRLAINHFVERVKSFS